MRALNYTYISKVSIDIFMWQWRYIYTDTQDWTCWGRKLCIKWDWDIERQLTVVLTFFATKPSTPEKLASAVVINFICTSSLTRLIAGHPRCWLLTGAPLHWKKHLYIERIYHWIKWFIVTIKRVQSRPDVCMEFLTEIRYYLCKLLLMVKNSAQHF